MDEILCEVETDKVTVEIRAPDAGVITDLCAAEGDTVLVGADLVKYLKGATGMPPPCVRPPTPPAPSFLPFPSPLFPSLPLPSAPHVPLCSSPSLLHSSPSHILPLPHPSL